MKNKQFTKNDWLYWFEKYESGNFNWKDYYQTRNLRVVNNNSIQGLKKRFRKKYYQYKQGNYSIINNMTGKYKSKNCFKNKEINWDTFSRDELVEISKRYYEIQKQWRKKDKMQESKKFSFAVKKKAALLNISRSGIYKNYKNKHNDISGEKEVLSWIINEQGKRQTWTIKKPSKRYDTVLMIMIAQLFFQYKKIYGRERLSQCMLNLFNIHVNSRTIGNYMKKMGLKTITRVAKKQRETKNTCVTFPDLVKRNYNQPDVLATDVTYIPVSSSRTNHIYLSIAINHHTKYIEGWAVSEINDTKLVYDTLKLIKPRKELIIHSDHGKVYSSSKILKLINQKNAQISMSRVGNSLDNREAEYFFSNIKSECLNHLPTHKMKFNQIKKIIAKYIKFYNDVRIQSKLNWKPPIYAQNMSKLNTMCKAKPLSSVFAFNLLNLTPC